jgi:4-hydroxy-tetrahydrodipicolinate synthase
VIGTDASKFGRLVTAMATPFDDDLSLDLLAIDKLVTHLIETGTTSIVVSGTTGESPTLEDSEKRELLTRVIKRAAGQAKVIMGTGYNSTAKSIKATREAEELGADGVLVVAPYYNKPSQIGMIEHFRQVAGSTRLPVILYNIPGRTGVNVEVSTTLELARHCPNLHALKDSTGSVEQAATIAGEARADFRIYSGDDYLALPFLAIGGCGVVSVASHLIGKPMTEMIDHFFAGRLDQARALHYQWLPLFKGLFAAPSPTCLKYALSILNLCQNKLRGPLVPLDEQQCETMAKLMRAGNISSLISAGR